MKKNKRDFITVIVCVILSIICGLITKDLLIGGVILLSSLLCGYYASVGNRSNYIFGLINYLLIAYVSFKNNLYGIFFFYVFVFSPLQVHGFVTWSKNLNKENNVKVREFTLKNSIIIVFTCIIGSFLLGGLLSLIPNQQLAFLDAASNSINLCGLILMLLRFKEAWWVWLANNTMDLIIWLITVINGGENATMMLVSSVSFLIINIYGIIRWNIEAKINKNNK